MSSGISSSANKFPMGSRSLLFSSPSQSSTRGTLAHFHRSLPAAALAWFDLTSRAEPFLPPLRGRRFSHHLASDPNPPSRLTSGPCHLFRCCHPQNPSPTPTTFQVPFSATHWVAPPGPGQTCHPRSTRGWGKSLPGHARSGAPSFGWPLRPFLYCPSLRPKTQPASWTHRYPSLPWGPAWRRPRAAGARLTVACPLCRRLARASKDDPSSPPRPFHFDRPSRPVEHHFVTPWVHHILLSPANTSLPSGSPSPPLSCRQSGGTPAPRDLHGCRASPPWLLGLGGACHLLVSFSPLSGFPRLLPRPLSFAFDLPFSSSFVCCGSFSDHVWCLVDHHLPLIRTQILPRLQLHGWRHGGSLCLLPAAESLFVLLPPPSHQLSELPLCQLHASCLLPLCFCGQRGWLCGYELLMFGGVPGLIGHCGLYRFQPLNQEIP